MIQGRWFLAPLAGIPIASGWMAATRSQPVGDERVLRLVAGVVVIVTAGCLAIFWWTNAYRYAVNSGPLLFLGHAQWQPPLGWAPWLVCAAAGLLLMLIAGLSGGPIATPAPATAPAA
jgi:hypothetical protein